MEAKLAPQQLQIIKSPKQMQAGKWGHNPFHWPPTGEQRHCTESKVRAQGAYRCVSTLSAWLIHPPQTHTAVCTPRWRSASQLDENHHRSLVRLSASGAFFFLVQTHAMIPRMSLCSRTLRTNACLAKTLAALHRPRQQHAALPVQACRWVAHTHTHTHTHTCIALFLK